jgi:hypothetical protein
MVARVDDVGDLWAAMARHRRSLRRPMQLLKKLVA